MTGYVCRAHYRPVTWRGRGCDRCRTDTTGRSRAYRREAERAWQSSFTGADIDAPSLITNTEGDDE
jgi:hypothetical protein